MVSRRVISISRKVLWLVLVLLIVSAVTHMTSCASPAYYWQAASGHLALMHARRPVAEAIESGEADPATLQKLRLSVEIRAFAVDSLGLPDNDSYSQYVATGGDAVVWNVVAAPEFSLDPKTWCFPVSGCVPYRGYFDESEAKRFAEKMKERGFDVTVSPAIAYSTLGWFDDPLLDTMWRNSEAQFAAYLFHELAHQRIYIKGDAMFNESYASFVERIGVERWLHRREENQALQDWNDRASASADFNDLLAETREELRAAYATGAPAEAMRASKQAAFENLEGRYRQLRDRNWEGTDYFGYWFKEPPNNARFALLETYEGGSCAFESLYSQSGGDMRRFHELARVKSELPSEERRVWLQTACPDVASAQEL